MRFKSDKTNPAPRQPFASSVPPTLAEEQVAAADWQRRGLLDRLVRRASLRSTERSTQWQ